ncbi:hypothetical protein [Salinibaculum rarum]|uniref:hypothetical protein n=1 Tax=Salinibaculum rarum TaxID=3058903 RepID=UPI00265FBA22|nr:hypothetical protein [Salinibaculum sp. KK48]
MPECDYCGDSFEGDHAHLEHLRAEHEGELGSIDRRRIEEELETTDSDGFPTGPVVLGIVLAVAIAIVGYVIFVHGDSGGSGAVNDISVAQLPGQPTESAHDHGLINVTIDGQELDFSQRQFQRPQEYAAFHFEGGDGRVWHKHAPGVTLEYAMATLGIDVSEDSVTFDGTTYRDSDAGTNVTVTVDGESVDPDRYELSGASDQTPQQGDFVRIVVTTEG